MSLSLLCALLGKSRQAYYKQFREGYKTFTLAATVIDDVKVIRQKQPKVGTIKLYESLSDEWKEKGIKVGRDKLYAILDANHMLIRKRRKRSPRTTFSNHSFFTAPDLCKTFVPSAPNQLYVSDITYIPIQNGKFCYLFLVTDSYSKYVVGYKLARSMHARHAVEALMKAEEQRTTPDHIIHHSDRGIQYCCPEYVGCLQNHSYVQSNTQSSDPRDNSIAERLNGILKEELIYPFGDIYDYEEAKKRVDAAVHTYNTERLHLSCDLHTPYDVHQGLFKAINRWKKGYVN